MGMGLVNQLHVEPDKYNVRVLSDNKINLHSLQNRPEKLVKGSIFYQFLKLVQINLIERTDLTLYDVSE
jgi:hypothetical protein